jgi:hypothetical protein
LALYLDKVNRVAARIPFSPNINHDVAKSSLENIIEALPGYASSRGHKNMDFDQDRLLLVRAQLSEQMDALRLTQFDSNPMQFLMRLDAIRYTAVQHRVESVAEIAAHFEEAMQRVTATGGCQAVVENFTAIMDEAIGCTKISVEVAQTLLASVSMRLRN